MRMVTVMVDALLLLMLLLPMLWSWGVRGRHTRGPMQLWKWARCNVCQMMYVFSSLISIVLLKLHNFNFLLNILKKRERERDKILEEHYKRMRWNSLLIHFAEYAGWGEISSWLASYHSVYADWGENSPWLASWQDSAGCCCCLSSLHGLDLMLRK